MDIAVIGTGTVGSALARTFVRSGHHVTLVAKDTDKTRALAHDVGASASRSTAEAARNADVVVRAVPYSAAADVADELRPIANGKVVIDVTNPHTPDYSELATAGGPSAAEQIAERIPGARVAKAFNTLFASVQADPGVNGEPADALFATDDDAARTTLFELLESAGFRPVDVGALARARELEAMAFLNISVQMRHGGDWHSAFALTGAPRAATSVPAAAAA